MTSRYNQSMYVNLPKKDQRLDSTMTERMQLNNNDSDISNDDNTNDKKSDFGQLKSKDRGTGKNQLESFTQSRILSSRDGTLNQFCQAFDKHIQVNDDQMVDEANDYKAVSTDYIKPPPQINNKVILLQKLDKTEEKLRKEKQISKPELKKVMPKVQPAEVVKSLLLLNQ